jgi:DNA-binding NtrC family response regulator
MSNTVTIIDSDPWSREALACRLTEAGLYVVSFSGHRAALRFFADGGEAAALIVDQDILASKGTGFRLLRELRQSHADVPIILIGPASGADHTLAVESGADLVVETLWPLPALPQLVERALKNKRHRSQKTRRVCPRLRLVASP